MTDIPPPAPPVPWVKMHHGDLGLPPDPPLGVRPDSGSWIVPLATGLLTGLLLFSYLVRH
jgi:hypothetical protein